MGATSKIEWTDATWNPIRARNLATGKIGWHCEHVSEGCRFCYAETLNRRLGTGLDFKPGHRADLQIFLDEKMLLAPLRWKNPRRIFVNSMSDTFAEFVKDEWLDRMFAVMALTPRHTFQILTKRPERMQGYCMRGRVLGVAWSMLGRMPKFKHHGIRERPFPLPNVWLGVSAEDQDTFEERRQPLRDTPAAVRFFSLEPMLGAIDAGAALATGLYHWVICGGESGPHARPMHPDWVMSLQRQCAAAEVPFFFKQWGGKNKKAAGRLLDGIEHNGMPQ